MKKRKILFAVCAMFLLLTACQNAPEEAKEQALTEAVNATFTPTPEPTTILTPTPAVTATPTPEPTATAVPTEVPVQETADTYKKGTLTESGFESEWLNLRFAPQHGMVLQTQEEVDEYIRTKAGLDADTAIDYSTVSLVKEMHAYYETGTNLSVSVDRLTRFYSNLTEEEYIRLILEGFSDFEQVQQVKADESCYELEIGGEKYIGISIKTDYGTGEFFCQELIVRKKENRLINIILSYEEYLEEEALNLLRALGSYHSEPVVLPSPTPFPSTYEVGNLTENSFESEWLNLRFTATEGVHMYSREEVAELLPVGAWVIYDGLSDDELGAVTQNLQIEMLAYHESEASLMIQSNRIMDGLAAHMTAEDCARAMMDELTGAVNADYTIVDDLFTVEVYGEIYAAFSCKMERTEGRVSYQQYLLRKKENRMISIVVTYVEEAIEDAKYLMSLLGPFDSKPTVAPKEIPEESGSILQNGIFTAEGYENEWLDLRITLPEQVTMTDGSTVDEIYLEMVWEQGSPMVQFFVYDAEGETAESYLEHMKESLLLIGEVENMTYAFEEISSIVIGGQEYLNLFMTVETAENVTIGQNYCCRWQDNCIVSVVFTYADGFDEEIKEAVNAFGAY